MTLRGFALPIIGVLAATAAASAQRVVADNDNAGQLAFNNACRTCHSTNEGDNRLGPSLHDIIGRKAGSLPDFGYTSAMKQADLVWDKSTLDRFIANPDQVVPGNRMKPFGGIASADERAKIVGFLAGKSGG
jgi:cytochrome c